MNHPILSLLRAVGCVVLLGVGVLHGTPVRAMDADEAISRFEMAVDASDAEAVGEMMALPGFAALVDGAGRTPLFPVARAGRIDLATALVAAKTNINKRDAEGRSALLLAVIAGRADMVAWLIANGAIVQAPGDIEPLRSAVISGSPDVVRQVLAGGASLFPRRPDYPSSDALDASVVSTRPEILALLLETNEARAMPVKEVERLKFAARQLGDARSIKILEDFDRARPAPPAE